MEFEYDYSDGNCNMIYSSGGGKEIDERIWGIVKADPDRMYLLPVRVEKTWSGYLLFYDIRYATNMMAWKSMATRQELLRMDRQIQVAVDQLESMGVRRDYLVLQEQHMFVDDRTGEIRFVCIPLKKMAPEPEKESAPAWSEPVKESVPAWSEPEKESAPAWSEPEKEGAPALSEPVKESAAAWSEPVKESAPALSESVKESAPAWSEPARELPPYEPASPDEWNPAEGRDAWTPESESWGAGWGPSEDSWNPAEGRDAWAPEGRWEPEKSASDEWHPEPGHTDTEREPFADKKNEEKAWIPEGAESEPSAAEGAPGNAAKETEAVPDSDFASDEDEEATQLLLPSRKAPIEDVPAAVITRVRTGERYTIRKTEVTLGKRERTVDFCLKNNPAMSRDHCVIRYKNGDFYIEDLNSSNFTYVDGIRVMPETETILKDGCKIQLADEQFLFNI